MISGCRLAGRAVRTYCQLHPQGAHVLPLVSGEGTKVHQLERLHHDR